MTIALSTTLLATSPPSFSSPTLLRLHQRRILNFVRVDRSRIVNNVVVDDANYFDNTTSKPSSLSLSSFDPMSVDRGQRHRHCYDTSMNTSIPYALFGRHDTSPHQTETSSTSSILREIESHYCHLRVAIKPLWCILCCTIAPIVRVRF